MQPNPETLAAQAMSQFVNGIFHNATPRTRLAQLIAAGKPKCVTLMPTSRKIDHHPEGRNAVANR